MKELLTRRPGDLPDLPPATDRRVHERIDLKIPLRVTTYGTLAQTSHEAICSDLSEGGVAFDSAAELPVGEIVELEFQTKGESPHRCHIRLTYRMRRRYGGYFLDGQ